MKQKKISLEILRIIAMCMVIFNHTGENGFELFRTAHGTWLWYVAILLDVISKAGVPVFFMISGVLLLGKEESIKDIFIKRILRYAIIIVLFSFVYYIRLYIQHPEYGFSIKYFVKYIYSTPFIIPYWFLYRYMSFLLLLPVLRAIALSLKEDGYLLLIGLTVFIWFSPVWEKLIGLDPIAITNGLNVDFMLYPVIGYGIANVISERFFNTLSRIAVFVIFIINWICSVLMNTVEYKSLGEYSGENIDRFCGIPAVVIFYFIIYLFEKKKRNISMKVSAVVTYIGSATLCVYLFEDMLRSDIFLKMFGLVSGNAAKLLMCIPYMACIVASGVVISTVLRRIPGIKLLKL